jgi:hypothetical protein
VNQAGVVLDPNGIAISSALSMQTSSSIAFDGTNYPIVWQDRRSGDGDIYGSRVSQSGVVLDTAGIAISTAADRQRNPTVAFNGIYFLVAWQDEREGDDYDIYATRVNQSGIVLDTNGIPISTIRFEDQKGPSIAYDGNNYLVVWYDERNGYYDIYGARVSQSGIVLDPNGIAISKAANDQRVPSVAFDGSNYIVAWEDYRSGSYSDIYGAKVSPSGTIIDSFLVSTQPRNQYTPVLTGGIGNQIFIIYSGWTDEYQGRTYNTYRIWGKFYPFVRMEEEHSTLDAKRSTLEIYPNPAKSVIRVRVPFSGEEATAIKIFDVSGKLVREIASSSDWQTRNDSEVAISLKGINPGIYFLQLGKETKKFLVVK